MVNWPPSTGTAPPSAAQVLFCGVLSAAFPCPQFAPVCAGLNLILLPFFEGSAPFRVALDLVGLPVLIDNATTALALNIAVVFLIGCASSLVLTLSGVVKDILLVAGSVLIMGSTVTFTQMVGYAIALAGLVVFKLPKETTDKLMLQARSAFGR